MLRSALIDAWPLAVLLALVLGAMATLVQRLTLHAGWRSLLQLHRDEAGGVQSLSFVLTVPFFIMLMLLAVQITQVMLGMMVVQYAAFAAARSATVWIPANVSLDEPANCISRVSFDRPVAQGGEYVVQAMQTGKFEKIRSAAALACVPIAPSRDLGLTDSTSGMTASLVSVYQALAPSSASNARLPQRLANKWAYANDNTLLAMRVFHRADEPPLMWHDIPPYRDEFAANEIGFRDKIQITVTHRFALLPGPGRLLSRPVRSGSGDETAGRIQRRGGVYYVPLTATATLGNEGEKPLESYAQTSL